MFVRQLDVEHGLIEIWTERVLNPADKKLVTLSARRVKDIQDAVVTTKRIHVEASHRSDAARTDSRFFRRRRPAQGLTRDQLRSVARVFLESLEAPPTASSRERY